jgi:hypothetical protein
VKVKDANCMRRAIIRVSVKKKIEGKPKVWYGLNKCQQDDDRGVERNNRYIDKYRDTTKAPGGGGGGGGTSRAVGLQCCGLRE